MNMYAYSFTLKFQMMYFTKEWLEAHRSTNIFRGSYSSFKEVLNRQQAESLHEDVVDPIENEADYLFVIRNNKDVNFTIEEIVHLAKDLSPTQK